MNKRNIAIEDLLRLKLAGDPQISPDGRHVAFTVKTVDPEKNLYLTHLWLAEVSTGSTRQFTHGDVSDSAPRWSPDGKQIAFLRTRDRRTQIWALPFDGGEACQLTRLDEGTFSALAWSPDGKQIAFTFTPVHPDWTQAARKQRGETGRSSPPRVLTRLHYRLDGVGFLDCRRHLWVCDAATGEARQITDGDSDDHGAAWSPSGQWIAFAANRRTDADRHPFKVDLWLVAPESGELRKIPIASSYRSFVPESLAWSPDGRQIAYFAVAPGAAPWLSRNARLWVAPVAGGEAQCLTDELDRTAMNMTISDGGVHLSVRRARSGRTMAAGCSSSPAIGGAVSSTRSVWKNGGPSRSLAAGSM